MQYYKDIAAFIAGKVVFCGIDVHHKHWSVCMFCDGEIIEKMTLRPEYAVLHHLLSVRYAMARSIQVVYEAGFSGFWLYRKLTADGYDCVVTPPNRIPRPGDKVKTDPRDAEKLARFLSGGLLKAVVVPPSEVEADRRVSRRREQLSKQQTRVKNQINQFLCLHGLSRPATIRTRWSKAYMKWLSDLCFEHDSDGFVLKEMIRSLAAVRESLAEASKYLRTLSRLSAYRDNYLRITVLRGVGLITAMTFLLELFSLPRFTSAARLSSYLGLTPSQHSSGEKVRLGHITREGNAHLRWVLVESAWTVVKHDPHLRDKYHRLCARGLCKNKAIVAVARSLALRLRRCILDQVEYVIGVC